MKLGSIMGAAVLLTVMFIWISPAICEMQNNSNQNPSYESMFENCLMRCKSKAELSGSRSKNIRQAAYMASLKADFLRGQKIILIDEMIRSNMELKSYKIHYFLNDRFFAHMAWNPELKNRFADTDLDF